MPQVHKVTQPLTANWLGRRGTQVEFRFDRKAFGQRVVFTRWEDTGITEVRAIEGDGRETPGFKQHFKGAYSDDFFAVNAPVPHIARLKLAVKLAAEHFVEVL